MSLLALPLGQLIGLSLGALGGGGSILTVPALVYGLDQDPHTATTSSLLIVGATSLTALVPHARGGRVRTGQGIAFGVLGVGGSLVGSRLSAAVPARVLLLPFAALILLVAALMLRRARQHTPAGPPAPDRRLPIPTVRPLRCHRRRIAHVLVAATVVGLLTAFFGVGGGFALVPAPVLALGFSMPTAVGTSLLVIAINSPTALAFRAGGGWDLNWPLIGTFVGAAVLGSLLGERLAARLPVRHLTVTFAVLLIAVAFYTGARSLA